MELRKILKQVILRNLPVGIKNSIQNPVFEGTDVSANSFVNLSFSQEGEDLVLNRLMQDKANGFFVDVGAHHPLRFSNTYKFYLQGWKGINIDPLPNSMQLFNKIRTRDINLEIAILENPSSDMTYYMFDEPALNTFDKELATERNDKTPYHLVNQVIVPCYKLSDILEKHLPKGQFIDFLSIDVEGMDLEVLKSNDWAKFKPQYVVIESLFSQVKEDLNSKVNQFLMDRDYALVSKTASTLIYKISK